MPDKTDTPPKTNDNPFMAMLEGDVQSKQPTPTQQATRKVTPPREQSRDTSRSKPRQQMVNDLSRDDIQFFTFQLRDELKAKAKVQAEVPFHWQDELEQIANDLNVKKLELYRYIIGDFLGKTPRHDG